MYQNIDFWICVGLFLYFAGNFFFLLYSTSNSKSQLRIQMQIIYSIVTITKNLFLGFSLFASEEQVGESRDEILYPKDLNLDTFTPNNIN